MKKIIKILPLLLLFTLVFNFIHSEIIDQLEGNSKCEAQDYCTLVETASVKTAASDLLKSNFEKSICFHCVIEIDQNNYAYQDFNYGQNNLILKPARVYLNNQVLLI